MHTRYPGMYFISAIMFIIGAFIVYQALAVYQRNELAIYGIIVMAYSIVRLYLMKRFHMPRNAR